MNQALPIGYVAKGTVIVLFKKKILQFGIKKLSQQPFRYLKLG